MDTPEEKSHPQNECFNFTEIGVVENGVENYVSHVNAFNAMGAEKALTGNDLLWLTFCQKQSIHAWYRIKCCKTLKYGTELQYHPCNMCGIQMHQAYYVLQKRNVIKNTGEGPSELLRWAKESHT